jgi:hypothetical protein
MCINMKRLIVGNVHECIYVVRYVMYYIYVYYIGEEGCFFNIPFQRLIPISKQITCDMRY